MTPCNDFAPFLIDLDMDKIALIKAEIERLYNDKSYSEDRWDMGYDCACEDIMSFLSTLESEEPDKSLEEAANNYLDGVYGKLPHSDLHIAIFIAGAKWQVEQFEKNRLAACEKQTKEEYDREMEFAVSIIEKEHRQPTFSDAINYGIEWQKKQIPMPEDTVLFNKGVAEGKRLMMEEAVEYEVMDFSSSLETHPLVSIHLDNKKYRFGDKVRIIVCKKED